MKYAIDYRRMHTGIHGLILFDTKEQAEESLGLLQECDDELAQWVFDNSCAVIDEVDYRALKDTMKDVPYQVNVDGYVSTVYCDIVIINYGELLDLYV